MSAPRLPAVLVGIALVVNIAAAISASHIDPPANDLLLHGQMVERATSTLADFGWSAFQDPWFPELNGGFPLFHHYPHLPHQWTAAAAATFHLDPWAALSGSSLLALLLLPGAVFVGGRWLGLSSTAAAASALVFATTRSLDTFGHTPLEYGFGGHGLFGQLWGMTFAALALPAWVAACSDDGAGLSRLPRWGRVLLAGMLASLVIRSSLPAGYLLGICAFVVVALGGPARSLPIRAIAFGAVGVVTVVLSAGFLVPFAQDLGATNSTLLELLPELRDSVGAVEVLRRLSLGFYLDGGWTGPWTLLLGATLVGVPVAMLRSESGAGRAPPVLLGLVAATILSILLLFGRATWGQWLADLPLLGRFHDHRYVLGLHLLAPWVVGAGLAAAAETLRRAKGDRAAGAAITAIVALVVLAQLHASREELARYDAVVESLEVARPELDALLQEARTIGGPVALAGPDEVVGGTTRLSWLRRHGIGTVGRPLYHYSHVHDFALYWTGWVAGDVDPGGRPVASPDLLAAGAARLLGPPGRAQVRSPRAPDAALVRSDLLVRTGGSNVEGLPIRWFTEGMHMAGQYPTLDLGVGAPAEPSRYLRTTDLEARDASALQGLPRAAGLGAVLTSDPGPRPGDRVVKVRVSSDKAWLVVPTSWHPGWTATIDGSAATSHMLAPGWIGVPVPVGDHLVELTWRTAPWRGPWAACNIGLYLLGLLALAPALRRSRSAA